MVENLHIFLADDDMDDVDLFRHTLYIINAGIQLQAASNGLQALQLLEHRSAPDLIFLDLNMPMVDGKKCLQILKKDERLKSVPVIMFTTSSFPSDISECLAMGAVCFITKPTDIIRWRDILRAITANIQDITVGLKKLDGGKGIYYQT